MEGRFLGVERRRGRLLGLVVHLQLAVHLAHLLHLVDLTDSAASAGLSLAEARANVPGGGYDAYAEADSEALLTRDGVVIAHRHAHVTVR